MLRIAKDALTFDDVLLVPGHSTVLPHTANLKTKLTSKIELNIPLNTADLSSFINGEVIEDEFLKIDEIKPSKKSSENVETMTSSRKEDILEGVGMMLPEGSREKMRKSSKERKEAFDRALKEKPLMDRIQGFFRTDNSEDRALLEALEGYNKDLDYRTRYSNRGQGGDKPLKAEYRKAMDTLLQQAKLGKRG